MPRKVVVLVSIVIIGSLTASCRRPPPEGVYPCHAVSDCPQLWYCRADQLCWQTPDLPDAFVQTDATLPHDAGAVDAPQFDAATTDAATIDAARCTPTSPPTETCDGIDNDCDGTADGVMATASCMTGETCSDAHCTPRHVWSGGFGGASDVLTVEGVALDAAGNAYIAGELQGTTNLGGGVLQSGGGSDWFVASFDATGDHRWSRTFGGTLGDYTTGVVVSGDRIVIPGMFSNVATFAGTTYHATSTSGNAVLLALDPATGADRWSRMLADVDPFMRASGDDAGNVFVAASARGVADVGGGSIGNALHASWIVASFDRNGGHRWSNACGTPSSVMTGSLPAAGWPVVSAGAATFGITLTLTPANCGGANVAGGPVAIVSYDATTGTYRSLDRVGSDAGTIVTALARDGGGWIISGNQTTADVAPIGGRYLARLVAGSITSSSVPGYEASFLGTDATGTVIVTGRNRGPAITVAGAPIPDGTGTAQQLVAGYGGTTAHWAHLLPPGSGGGAWPAAVSGTAFAIAQATSGPLDFGGGPRSGRIFIAVYRL